MICTPLRKSDASEVMRELGAGCLAKIYRLNCADGKSLLVAVSTDSDTALAQAEEVLRTVDSRFRHGQRI